MKTILVIAFLVLCGISIIVDYKRLKAVQENTATYKELCDKVVEVKTNIDFYVKDKEEKSISVDEVVDDVYKRLLEMMKKANRQNL